MKRMFGISVLVLFFEVFLIRWVSTEINIFAYLQNAVLVLCLFALGAGCLKPAARVPLYPTFSLLGLFFLLLAFPLTREALGLISGGLSLLHDFVVWDQMVTVSESQIDLWSGVLVGLAMTIVLSIFIFDMVAPLGQLLGGAFNAPGKPLKLYSANILGSLVGILLFAMLGVVSASPVYWLLALVLLALPFALEDSANRAKNLASFVFVLLGGVCAHMLDPSIETRWSPYQKLALFSERDSAEYEVLVNNSGYQQIQNNAADTPASATGSAVHSYSNYNLPSLFKRDARRILVVGAGTGNDVAGALRWTSGEIVAVEIDPVIVDFGKRFHPERPYQNSRVTVVNTDARAFFERSKEKFDLIVFGLLDSHTTTSLSSARLDHFVYTREAVAAAKKLLADKGVFALIFQPQRGFIIERLAKTLTEAFGRDPRVVKIPINQSAWGGRLFLTGDEAIIEQVLANDSSLGDFFADYAEKVDLGGSTVEITSDDWPYLYLDSRRIPVLCLLLAVVSVFIWIRARRDYGLAGGWSRGNLAENLHFLALGTAFTLLEVYGINRAAIVFGNTWFTNCAVIGGVLGMILLANAIVERFPNIPKSFGFGGLFVMLIGVWFAPFEALMGLSLPLKVLAVMFLCGAPMLCSGIVFARSFDGVTDRPRALSANLFGALVGGALQVLSFEVGIKALLLVVALFYGLALIAEISPRLGRARAAAFTG